MQTASRLAGDERRRERIGPETRVSRTLTLRQWSMLEAAAKTVASDMQRLALNGGRRHRHYKEQAADLAADLVRAVHELERQ